MMLSETPDAKCHILCDSTFMQSLQQANPETESRLVAIWGGMNGVTANGHEGSFGVTEMF